MNVVSGRMQLQIYKRFYLKLFILGISKLQCQGQNPVKGKRSIEAQTEYQRKSKNLNPISCRVNNRTAVAQVNPKW